MSSRTPPFTLALTALLVLAAPGPLAAAWPPTGLPVCVDCNPTFPGIVWDGADGVYVKWSDARSPATTAEDIYVQRITGAGVYAPGWPASGAPVCVLPKYQTPHEIQRDPAGGAFVVWTDFRNVVTGGSSADIFVQKILADGSVAPGWNLNGNPATQAMWIQYGARILPDGLGGVFVTWDEDERWPDIYLQHLTSTGEVAPGYPPNGLPICTDPAYQGGAQLASDGAGGVFIAWIDLRDGAGATYVQHVLASGQVDPAWPACGRRLHLGRGMMNLLSDGAGGMYVTSAEELVSDFGAIYLQRLTSDAEPAPGWPADGVLVCNAPDNRAGIRTISDGTGGVYIAWRDFRDFYDSEVFVHRVRGDGSFPPGWPVDGLRMTDNLVFDDDVELAEDGVGGLFLSWERTGGPGASIEIRAHHLTSSGTPAPGWAPDGVAIPTGSSISNQSSIASDGQRGAYVVWNTPGVRVQRLVADGPVATTLALVSATADERRVRLEWFGAGAGGMTATIERRSAAEWEPIATRIADGTGHVRFEDSDVVPGVRYGYRLRYLDAGTTRVTAETWVEVPGAAAFALDGFQPNPAVGTPRVTFALPAAAAGRLELFDLAGRRVAVQDLGGLGRGRHVVTIGDGERLEPGAYLVRLTHADRTLIARGVVMR